MDFPNVTSPDWLDYYGNETVFITPVIQPIQIMTLVFYGLVVLLGTSGNAVVLWVTGFCMTRSVTSIWFLNLALADFLCCLSIPLLMVPLAHDDHWPFGPLACRLVKGLFYLVMYCSILQLVLISLDRLMLVKKPIWCQNNRRPKCAAFVCVAVWCLALVGSIPQFVYARQIEAGDDKRECLMLYPKKQVWLMFSFRFMVGFLVPFLVIVICHLMVYRRTQRGLSRRQIRAKRTVKVIVTVVLSFFLCWIPLHIVDFIDLNTPPTSPHSPSVYKAHTLALCLAYFNSCLNPLIYVCIGRSFQDRVNRSLRNILYFITEEPLYKGSVANTDTKSTSNGKEMSKI